MVIGNNYWVAHRVFIEYWVYINIIYISHILKNIYNCKLFFIKIKYIYIIIKIYMYIIVYVYV